MSEAARRALWGPLLPLSLLRPPSLLRCTKGIWALLRNMPRFVAIVELAGLGGIRVTHYPLTVLTLALAFALAWLPSLAFAVAFADGLEALALSFFSFVLGVPCVSRFLSVGAVWILPFWSSGRWLSTKGTESRGYCGVRGLVQVPEAFNLSLHPVQVTGAAFLPQVGFGS